NGGGKLDADRNAIDVRWATDSTGANQQVNQRMEVGDNERDESTRQAERNMQQRHTEHQEVTAKWDSTSNQTVIHSASGDTARAGLDLLRLATASRKLIIEF
ncbi:MAG: hypothetical protein M3256_28215, partial [Actinomycetota bacterium]|nr:hypothetical protein [Actinomycetota bacterium]